MFKFFKYLWWRIGYYFHQRKQRRIYERNEGIPFVEGDPIILQATAFVNPNKGIKTKEVYYNGVFVKHHSDGHIEWTGYDGSKRSPWHFSTVRKDTSNQFEKYERSKTNSSVS